MAFWRAKSNSASHFTNPSLPVAVPPSSLSPKWPPPLPSPPYVPCNTVGISPDATQIIEVDLNKPKTPKKPAVAERLANSPKKALTPEIIKSRQDRAAARREAVEQERLKAAQIDAAHAKEISTKKKGENSPCPSPMKN